MNGSVTLQVGKKFRGKKNPLVRGSGWNLCPSFSAVPRLHKSPSPAFGVDEIVTLARKAPLFLNWYLEWKAEAEIPQGIFIACLPCGYSKLNMLASEG